MSEFHLRNWCSGNADRVTAMCKTTGSAMRGHGISEARALHEHGAAAIEALLGMFQSGARRACAVPEITGVTADVSEDFHDEFTVPGHIASEITDVMMNR